MVILSSIVVISCVGVFFLLRDHPQDPYERHARRVHSGKRETSIYEAPLGPPGMRTRFKNWFRFGKKQEGWVRANSGDDEWDPSDLNPSYAPSFVKLSGARKEMHDKGNDSISSTYSSPSRPRVGRSMTSDSIELSVPPLAVDATSTPLPRDSYPHTFTSSPVSFNSVDVNTSYHIQSPDSDHAEFSIPSVSNTGSVRAMRKFESGTKFKEVIDF